MMKQYPFSIAAAHAWHGSPGLSQEIDREGKNRLSAEPALTDIKLGRINFSNRIDVAIFFHAAAPQHIERHNSRQSVAIYRKRK
jgi:hypothetical protein